LTPPWEAYEHPEGGVYFYNNELRLVTVDNMFDPTAMKAVLKRRHRYIRFLDRSDKLKYLPEDWEIWISFADGINYGVIHSWRERRCYVPLSTGGDISKFCVTEILLTLYWTSLWTL
jgi:hypothetical protein